MESAKQIINAIAAGITASKKETASQTVKKTYSSFKSLIQKQFADKDYTKGEMALSE